MAERCKCGNPAHGTLGMLVFCRTCIAGLAQLPPSMFKAPVTVQLHDGDRDLGTARWVPWSYMSKRERSPR